MKSGNELGMTILSSFFEVLLAAKLIPPKLGAKLGSNSNHFSKISDSSRVLF